MWYNYIYLNPFIKSNIYLSNFDLQLNHLPFYIGKGKDNRWIQHIKYPNDCNKYKNNYIKKILENISVNDYCDNYIIKFNYTDNEKDVLYAEKYLIEWFGTKLDVYGIVKRGPLLNMIRGGFSNPVLYGEKNGFYGKKHTEEVLKRIGECSSNRGWFGKNLSEQDLDSYKNNLSLSVKKSYKNNPSRKSKLSVSLKKYWKNIKIENPEIYNEKVNQLSIYVKQYWDTHTMSDDLKEHLSEKNKEFWKYHRENNTEYYQNNSENIKKRWKQIKENDIEKYKQICIKKHDFWKYHRENNTEYYQKDSENRKITNNYNIRKDKLSETEYKKYCFDLLGGDKNGMYNKGYLLSGKSNGRSLCWYIKTNKDDEFIIWGNMQKFIKFIKKRFKEENYGKSNLKPNPFLNMNDKEYLKSINWTIEKISTDDVYTKYKNIKHYE